MLAPVEVREYLDRLVDRLVATLGDRVIGVYVVGSLALNDYQSGQSDIDVYVVVEKTLTQAERLAVADSCRHRALPCPARRLELVIISAEQARVPSAAPRWEVNLNTGAAEVDHVGLDPLAEPSHWFVLDLALASERGVRLLGPPVRSVITSPSVAHIRRAQTEAVAWYAGRTMLEETAMAACRAWHWQETGTFASKRQALSWAATKAADAGAPSEL